MHTAYVCVCVCVCTLSYFSCVQLFVTLWTIACQALLFMECSRQEYWSGLPLPSTGDLPNPGIKPMSLVSPALAGRLFTTAPPGKQVYIYIPAYIYICPTLCDPMDCSRPGFPVLYYLPDFAQTHVTLSWWCHPAISSSVAPFSSCPI